VIFLYVSPERVIFEVLIFVTISPNFEKADQEFPAACLGIKDMQLERKLCLSAEGFDIPYRYLKGINGVRGNRYIDGAWMKFKSQSSGSGLFQ
jgi:hypothetical protein